MASKLRESFEGVNLTLYKWSIGNDHINEILKNNQDPNALLADVFDGNREKREIASIEFYHLAWEYYPELGPNPIVEVLAQFEYDRVFYNNYRDHTTHTVKTYLLGLYFYDQVLYIRNQINSFLPGNVDKKEAFIKAWTMVALCHDIGYIFENAEIEKHEEEWELLKSRINNMLSNPLSCVFERKGITKEKERRFVKTNKVFMQSIDSISEIESENENRRIWDLMQSGGTDAGLTCNDSVNGIHEYFEFASKKRTIDGRQGFMDHGVCSALLFGKVWYAFSDYLNEILNNDYDILDLSPLTKDDVINLRNNLDSTEKLLEPTINAIALHNINKEIWNTGEAITYKVFLDDFRMAFSKLPLACLLRLCDELQLWDRELFRKPQATDRIITGDDLQLVVSENMIYVNFASDKDFTNPKTYPGSEYNKLYKKLCLYLDKMGLDKILTCGVPRNNTKKKKIDDFTLTIEESLDGMEIDFCNQKESVSENEQWFVGAVNLDEDVHFSSFYLTQSMCKNLPSELKAFGYHNLVAVYEDFCETYYIPQKECVQAAENLIKYFLRNWEFGEKLLENISDKIEVLEKVFADLPERNSFQNLSDEQILTYYEKHNMAHTNLYIYARIPEVLDRGVPTFTMYLKNYLKGRAKELKDEEKLNEVFDILTYPEMLGYQGLNIIDICDIITLINDTSTDEEKQEWKSSNRRFLIRMKPEVVQRIEEYTNTWTYWGYHGYRDRALRDFNYFAEKLRMELTNKAIMEQEAILLKRQNEAAKKRYQMFAKYNIDEKHQGLFCFFSKIGTIKLKRRYCQLKNFYYLDQLLFEIAKRNKVSESVIRCMLPEEISSLLRGNKSVLTDAELREQAQLFVYHLTDDYDEVVYGSAAEIEAKKLKDMVIHRTVVDGVLFGEVASMGNYQGICRVVNRQNDYYLEPGEILVATDIDPDMFDLLKLAGAVLTETGGFTCHAAIVCRELQIPCIVGIPELTSYIRTGQTLDIDAGKGRVKVLTPVINEIIQPNNFNEENVTKNEIGAKAYSLFQMDKAGFLVPGFFCVRIKTLKEVLLKDTFRYEQNSNSLTVNIQNTLNLMDNEWWAIRSSTNREDGEFVSGAGQEITMLRVHKNDIMHMLYRIMESMKGYSGGGSIIIQKMILGSYSGVVLTDNPLGDSCELVIQAVPGGNEYLTSGKINPASYVYKKDLMTFSEEGEGAWKNLMSENLKEKLREQSMQIADFFGAPQDIEWTVQENRIYFLQSRNITKGCKGEQINIFSAKKSLVVDTLSIYQAYALPIHLRNHLLRTAAIVCWILDHWKGESLDEEVMIKTCLLHDIGNIVKGTDETFKVIFPDVFSEDCWQYWLNVRTHIGEKYGKTDIEATLNIAREINVDEKVLKLIEEKQFSHNKETFLSSNFEAKICAYADQRVSPNGILSLTGRLDEARIRHRGIKESSVNSSNYEELKKCAGKIETQIFKFVDGNPEDINDKSVEPYIMGLKLYEF